MSNLNPTQFNEWDVEPRYAPDLGKVHGYRATYAVPTQALHNAYSHEFDVPAHKMDEVVRSGQHDSEHEGNDPLVQHALENSVKSGGIHTPITVGFTPGNSHHPEPEYSIVDGSHRLLAAMRTGTSHVPVRMTR